MGQQNVGEITLEDPELLKKQSSGTCTAFSHTLTDFCLAAEAEPNPFSFMSFVVSHIT